MEPISVIIWTYVVVFSGTALLTLAGLIEGIPWPRIKEGYMKVLFKIFVVEIMVGGVGVGTAFFFGYINQEQNSSENPESEPGIVNPQPDNESQSPDSLDSKDSDSQKPAQSTVQEEACKQNFTDASLAEEILNACTLVIDSEPDDETLLDARLARAQAHAVLAATISSSSQENYVQAETDFNEAFRLASLDSKSPSDFTSRERQIAFLEDLWPEHLGLVRDNTGQCQAASDAYETSMSAYNHVVSGKLEIENDELLMLLELGHFLSNRERAWPVALDYYNFILDTDSNYLNARLSLVHARLMSIENPEAAKASHDSISDLLSQIENESQGRGEIQATALYHRGSLLSKQGNYKSAIGYYNEILDEYSTVFDDYPLLEFISMRDMAFALFADGDNSSDTAFDNALEVLSKIDGISDKERNSRRMIIEDFRENNDLLESYIEVGFAFAELVVHDFESAENAFIEAGHEKFYGCYRE